MNKKGFTIIELLLCIAIIGIVSALGMSIAKKSTAKAYTLFFYSAYTNLNDAIAYAEENREDDASTALENQEDFRKALISVLAKTDGEGKQAANADGAIETANGIKYTISSCTTSECTFRAEVPQAKTRENNGVATFDMTYIPRSISGIAGVLIPVAGGSINIQTRRDLLPTYVDDGLVGVSKDSSVVRYYSFQNAYCVASKKVSLDG